MKYSVGNYLRDNLHTIIGEVRQVTTDNYSPFQDRILITFVNKGLSGWFDAEFLDNYFTPLNELETLTLKLGGGLREI